LRTNSIRTNKIDILDRIAFNLNAKTKPCNLTDNIKYITLKF